MRPSDAETRAHADWLLTPYRAAIHVPSGTAVVADVHLGYAESRCRRGDAVPVTELAAPWRPLLTYLVDSGVHRLVVAGDLCENGRHDDRVAEWLDLLAGAGVSDVTVVPGNHDRGLAGVVDGSLRVVPRAEIGNWHVVHGDGRLPRGRVVLGHHHPCLEWQAGVRAPCYLIGPGRLILPAFSPDTAGGNVLRVRAWQAYRCCVIAGNRVLDFGRLGTLAGRNHRGPGQNQGVVPTRASRGYRSGRRAGYQ